MLVEKEVIRDGTYWYLDEATGLPRKLVVTPELRKHWHDQGNAMLSAGLTVPVPYEHDFASHPMTPKDKLLNNAGWVKEYRNGDKALSSVVDVQDPEVAKKLPRTIRWTSPWINSFVDGAGKAWTNVISHLALTTRPRIIKQSPFGSITAALSMAQEIKATGAELGQTEKGFCLSRAGRLFTHKTSKRQLPRYPVAFSAWGGSIKLSADDAPPKKGDLPDDDADSGDDTFDISDDTGDDDMSDGMTNPLADAGGDVKMEELLCDLLQALGVPMPDESNENEFKRHLYEAAMSKIKELTSKGMGSNGTGPDQNQPPSQQPNASQPNPLITQEQQPMYMSLEQINALTDPVNKALALENYQMRAQMETDKKVVNGLIEAKLKEANTSRTVRVASLGKRLPSTKADLDAMLALPAMALSMGDDGAVVDPMAQTLAVLEKGISDLPKLLTTPSAALSENPQPQDQSQMTPEKEDEIADAMARKMGAPPPPPQKKAS